MVKARSKYKRNVLTLVTGTTIAQAIPIAISPILTRLYTPEDFGFYAYYFSASMVLSVMATAKYEMAITLPENNETARRLVQLSILIAIVFSLFLALLIFPLRDLIGEWLGVEDPDFLMVLPVGTLLIGINQSFYYYANRKEAYARMATSRVARSTIYSLGAGLLGVWRPGGFGLLWSDIAGLATSSAVLLDKKFEIIRPSHFKSIKQSARQFIDFPKFSIFAGFLEKMSGQAPVFLLTKLFLSSGITGFFALAQRTIVAPSDLITRAMSDVFRQQASRAFATHGKCDDIFRSTFRRLAIIAIVAFPIGFFMIEDAFAFVFGEDWRTAGVYARIMLPMFFCQFIVSPLSIMFIIAQKQKYDLVMQITLVFLVFAAFLGGYTATANVEACLQLFTLVYCIKYIVELLFSYKFSKGDGGV